MPLMELFSHQQVTVQRKGATLTYLSLYKAVKEMVVLKFHTIVANFRYDLFSHIREPDSDILCYSNPVFSYTHLSMYQCQKRLLAIQGLTYGCYAIFLTWFFCRTASIAPSKRSVALFHMSSTYHHSIAYFVDR